MIGESGNKKTVSNNRVVFVDQARSIAILLMLIGHSLHRFLAEPYKLTTAYQNYQFVRGISSALFLTVSGFSFVVASFHHFGDYTALSPRMLARFRRIALILFLGTILHLWGRTLTESLQTLTPQAYERFLRFDVLQNIAFGLLLLHATVWMAGRERRFLRYALSIAIGLFLLAFLTYRKDVDALLPPELAAPANLYHYSQFPVVPYTGYMFIGALFGYAFLKMREQGKERFVFAAAIFAALAMFVFEWTIRNWIEGGIFPYSGKWPKTPGNTFARAGCALIVISLLYFLGRVKIVFPRLAFLLSKDALTIYFVHLPMVYGTRAYTGCFRSRAGAMTPLEVFYWIVFLIASMTALAWSIAWLRKRHFELTTILRRTLIAGGTIAFFAWPKLTVLRAVASFILGGALSFYFHRYRLRAKGEPGLDIVSK